jgi:branched-chain amino acid aminotransferase
MALRETIRVQSGRIPLLDRHLARLRAGGCDLPTVDRARDEALRAAAAWPDTYGRMSLIVDIDGSTRAAMSDRPSTIDVPGGPRIALVETDEPHLPPGAAKPADRTFWDRALAAVPEADVAVLVSRDGRLIDTSQATLWLRVGDRLLTPPSPPALAGVSRGVVFDLAPSLGFIAEESVLVASDIESAEEVILTTAVAGAVAASGRGGIAADALTRAFAEVFSGSSGQDSIAGSGGES